MSAWHSLGQPVWQQLVSHVRRLAKRPRTIEGRLKANRFHCHDLRSIMKNPTTLTIDTCWVTHKMVGLWNYGSPITRAMLGLPNGEIFRGPCLPTRPHCHRVSCKRHLGHSASKPVFSNKRKIEQTYRMVWTVRTTNSIIQYSCKYEM